jgi:hypothetical protein
MCQTYWTFDIQRGYESAPHTSNQQEGLGSDQFRFRINTRHAHPVASPCSKNRPTDTPGRRTKRNSTEPSIRETVVSVEFACLAGDRAPEAKYRRNRAE